jgi:hypothetical protein
MVYQKSRNAPKVQRFLRFLQGGMVLFLAPMFGCDSSDGLNRQAISGSVTLDGQPISLGAILFEPATQESGTAVGATIRQGGFAISRREGPVPGSYRVRLYSSSGVQASPAKGQTDRTPRPMVERLPARYNTQTEIVETVLSGHVNRYRFNLSSSGPTNLR